MKHGKRAKHSGNATETPDFLKQIQEPTLPAKEKIQLVLNSTTNYLTSMQFTYRFSIWTVIRNECYSMMKLWKAKPLVK